MYILFPPVFLTAPAQSSTSGSAFILPPYLLHNWSDKVESFASWSILLSYFEFCDSAILRTIDSTSYIRPQGKMIFFNFPYPWITNLGVLRVHCLSQIPQCWSKVGLPNSAGVFFLRFLFFLVDLFVLFKVFFFFFRLRLLRFFPQNPISPLFAPTTHVPHL